MDRAIKLVLILGTIFLIVIIWIGPKFKMAVLPEAKPPSAPVKKVEPSVPKDKAAELSADELEKIDEMLREIEERKRNATVKEAESLNEIRKILEAAKAKGRLPLPEEPPFILPEAAAPEEIFPPPLPSLPEEGLETEQPAFLEMPLPEELPGEYQK